MSFKRNYFTNNNILYIFTLYNYFLNLSGRKRELHYKLFKVHTLKVNIFFYPIH